MPCWFTQTNAHAHQCCIFQSHAKTVLSRMKLTMREPASMTTDTWSRHVTSDFYSTLQMKTQIPCLQTFKCRSKSVLRCREWVLEQKWIKLIDLHYFDVAIIRIIAKSGADLGVNNMFTKSCWLFNNLSLYARQKDANAHVILLGAHRSARHVRRTFDTCFTLSLIYHLYVLFVWISYQARFGLKISYPAIVFTMVIGLLNCGSFIVHILLLGTSKVFTLSVFLPCACVHYPSAGHTHILF